MTELIKGLVQVRDGLSLIAFLSLVLLVAFKTQKVPELFFGLLRDKLTRAQFAALLHRFMTIALVVFLALVSLAILAQVLSHMTLPNALTIDDLRKELAKLQANDDKKLHAEAEFKLAMEQLNQRNFDAAIASLRESINAVPTRTAQEMLAYLYRDKGDAGNEATAWEQAMKLARQKGDAIAEARLDRVSVPAGVLEPQGDHDLIGSSASLPIGGDRYETATKLSPGFYNCSAAKGCFSWWFTLYLHVGQDLKVKFRTPSTGGLAGAAIYGTNGDPQAGAGDNEGTMRGNASAAGTLRTVDLVSPASGWYFLKVYADAGSVYRIQVL